MYLIMWRYEVDRAHEEQFRKAYGPAGDWTILFGMMPGFVGTSLLELDTSGSFVTIDRWESEGHFDQFLAACRDRYEALDDDLSYLTVSEELIGRGVEIS